MCVFAQCILCRHELTQAGLWSQHQTYGYVCRQWAQAKKNTFLWDKYNHMASWWLEHRAKSVSAQNLTGASLRHLEYAVKTFPRKLQICVTHLSSGKGVSTDILTFFTPPRESENKNFENWKTGIVRKCGISRDDVVFWQYFLVLCEVFP